jgi:hypothetical protein
VFAERSMMLRLSFSFPEASSSLVLGREAPDPRCSCAQFSGLRTAAGAVSIRASSVCVFGQ